MTPDQHRQLGESIVQVMTDMVKFKSPEFDVSEGSLEFVLGDSVGELVGGWRVTIERLGLD